MSLFKSRELRQTNPDKPWLWKPEWAAGEVRAHLGRSAIFMWVFAAALSAVSAPLLATAIPDGIRSGQYFVLFFLLVPLFAVLLLWGAIRKTFQARRFGRSRLALRTLPGEVGGQLAADLIVAGDLTGLECVEFRLICEHTVVTGSGKSRHTSTETVWENSHVVKNIEPRFGELELTVPIAFAIPPDAQPHDESNPRDKITWKLNAKASLPGADLDLSFGVPVFDLGGEAASRIASLDAEPEATPDASDADEPPTPQITVTTGAGQMIGVTLRAWPGVPTVFVTALIGVICAAVCAGTIILGLRGRTTMYIVSGISGLLALMMLSIVRQMFNRYELSIANQTLTTVRQRLFSRHEDSVRLDEIQSVDMSENARIGSTEYYGITSRTLDGRNIALASWVRGQPAARWIVARINSAAQMRPNDAPSEQ